MALNKQETRNSLFGNIKKTTQQPLKDVATAHSDIHTVKNDTTPFLKNEWEFIERITLPLSIEQREGVERIAKNMRRNRSQASFNKEKRERITANTIIRALIDTLLEKENLLALATANTEEEAKLWVKKILKE